MGLFFLSEFKTFCNAQKALNIFTGKKWKLKGRHALTPRHLHTWLRSLPPELRRSQGLQLQSPPLEQQALQVSVCGGHGGVAALVCRRWKLAFREGWKFVGRVLLK